MTKKSDGDLIELDELTVLLREREGPSAPQRSRRRLPVLPLVALAVSLGAAALVVVAVTRDGSEKAQRATTASKGTTSPGTSAAACTALVEWEGTTYYGGRVNGSFSLAGALGKGTIPSCQDTVPGSPSPAQSVALVRVAGLPPEMAVALAGDTGTLYQAPQFFPQIPGTRLHDIIYGPGRNVPNERVGEGGCPASTTDEIEGSIVSSGLGVFRVDSSNPDAKLPGDNPIFTDAHTKVERADASIPYAEPGDAVRASVVVCRNPDEPHYLKLIATRVTITPR